MRRINLQTDGCDYDIIDWIKSEPTNSLELDFTQIFNKDNLYCGTISLYMGNCTLEQAFAREIDLGCTFELVQYKDTRISFGGFSTYFEVNNNVFIKTR